jgi:hypothetical protein
MTEKLFPYDGVLPPADGVTVMERIDTLWAFFSQGEYGEGLVAFEIGGKLVPMIAADEARLEFLRPMVQSVADQSGATIKLVKFTQREVIEELVPCKP